ncbi:MAG TPA: ABC transporter permease [Acidimicrobiales bacterium]|nr:ABC transporter permease [Acidimicrobiales bacterium]
MTSTLLARRVVERNALAYRRMWLSFAAAFVEPLLYLLSVGIGVGALVGKLPGPGGHLLSYREFVAPGLLAASAMMGSIFDTTIAFFVKYKYLKTYDAMLATPISIGNMSVGEVVWGLLRGAIYAGGFLVVMLGFGMLHSWWALLCLPVASLVGYAFAGVGLAAAAFMRSWTDFDYVNGAVFPMFLFSATFFPLSRYPHSVQSIVSWTPLYQGVALERALIVGAVGPGLIVRAAYLVVMGAVGLRIAVSRLGRLLQP